MPFFNSERHIGACIASLQEQDFSGAYEIILVNNGSQDASPSVVEGFDGLTVLEEATPGAYAARNTGIRRAQAPLIAFTDADCVVDNDWLSSIQTAMDDDPQAAILVGHCRYPANASLALRWLGAYENAKTEYVTRCPSAYHFAYANNMAVRSSVFEEIGLFKEWRRAADSEIVHRLAARRPDLRLAFHAAIRVTHMEFLSARERARRLALYTQTNSKIETFQELGVRRRLAALLHLLR